MELEYEAVIGLEVHVELKTAAKIFCSCPADFGAPPNTNVCPVCLGMPGALPVLSKKTVELALRAGIAFESEINRISWFDRKNYFYPDLPKGYQITQFERPICEGGSVVIETDAGKRNIRLTRIHLEEDAGKLIHRGEETLIDYNRCGIPLIEIVSEADMHTASEVKAYLASLRRTLLFAGVSDCKMNEGSMRCDVNVSVHRPGEKLGVKCEIKNVNSINYAGRAVDDEIKRQTAILRAGGTVRAETRRFNENNGKTELMRPKEKNIDYRYFTEPNIPPLVLSEEYIEGQRNSMPEMPDKIINELCEKYALREEDARIICEDPSYAQFFMKCVKIGKNIPVCANLFIGEVIPNMKNNVEYISPEFLTEIAEMFTAGEIISGAAKTLIGKAANERISPRVIAIRDKMLKITDPEEISAFADEAILFDERSVSDYISGKSVAAKRIMGGVMRKSRGLADPIIAERIIIEKLEKIKKQTETK